MTTARTTGAGVAEHGRPAGRGGSRGRSVLAGAFGIIAVVGVLASVFSMWVQSVLFDTTTVSKAVDTALQDPEVTGALADRISEQIVEAIDLESLVDQRVTGSLEPLRPVLSEAAHQLVRGTVVRLLEDDRVRTVVVRSTEEAHRRILTVLERGSLVDGVTTTDGEVTVNLLPLMGRVLGSVQDRGLLRGVTLPVLEPGGDPAVQRRQLSAALGRELPEEFGEIVVFRSDAVAKADLLVGRAQQAIVVFRRSVILVLAVTVASAVGAVAAARRRRRATAVLAVALVATAALAHATVEAVIARVPTLAANPGSRQAVRLMVESLARGLLTAFGLVLVASLIGLLVALAASARGGDGRASDLLARAEATLRRERTLATGGVVLVLALVLVADGFRLAGFGAAAVLGAAVLGVAWTGSSSTAAGSSTRRRPDDDGVR